MLLERLDATALTPTDNLVATLKRPAIYDQKKQHDLALVLDFFGIGGGTE